MIDKNEIDRVRWIHGHLDHWAATLQPHQTHFFCEPWNGPRVEFTAEEVRAWPATKADLITALAECSAEQLTFLSNYEHAPVQYGRRDMVVAGCQEAIARGLVMYREMLPATDNGIVCTCSPHALNGADQRCPEHGRRCDAPGCDELCGGIAGWTRSEPDGKRLHFCNRRCLEAFNRKQNTGRINAGRLVEVPRYDHLPDEQIAALTQALPGNVEARKRMVAALSREHEKASDMTGLLHPLAHWSGRNPGRRAR